MGTFRTQCGYQLVTLFRGGHGDTVLYPSARWRCAVVGAVLSKEKMSSADLFNCTADPGIRLYLKCENKLIL